MPWTLALVSYANVYLFQDSKKVFRKWFCDVLDAALSENDGEIDLAQILMIWTSEKSKVLQLVNDVESGNVFVIN